MEHICILMSTYCGEKYIEEQLNSILQQKGVITDIYIRDDGSTDNTINLIISRPEYNKRIFLLQGENVGATKSFYKIAKYCSKISKKYNFYAFSDQDDVWLSHKLNTAVTKLKEYPVSSPNMVYTNLKVVDENLKFLYNRYLPNYVKNTKEQVLTEVCAWGCTCVFNQTALMEIAKVDTDLFVPHDNWILWVCALLGNTYYDKNPQILHREHGGNVSGSTKKGLEYFACQFDRLKKIKRMKPDYEYRAKLFLNMYGHKISATDRYSLNLIANYRVNKKYKFILLFTKKLSSGHFVKEIARRTRILFNVL